MVKHSLLKTWVWTKTYWCAGVWLMGSYFLYKFFLYKKEDESFSQTVEKKLNDGAEQIKVLEKNHESQVRKRYPIPSPEEATHWMINREQEASELKE